MELAHSLLLNEEALAELPPQNKPIFIYEWLRFLDRVLLAAQKSDIKASQTKLVEQLTAQIATGPGPPTRLLLGRCLATLFAVGDTFTLFGTINACNDVLKSKDDSPSFLNTRLAAIAVIGAMYEKLGRMVGRSFEETSMILLRSLKNAESQARAEIMNTFSLMVAGLGSAGGSVQKDIYKAARGALVDRVMAVRCSAANCLIALCAEAQFVYTTELEMMTAACFKGFEGSNYEVRCAIGDLLGEVLAMAHNPLLHFTGKMTSGQAAQSNLKTLPVEDCMQILAAGFLRGGSGFLKGSAAGGAANIAKEVRTGVTLAYVSFAEALGGTWLERHLPIYIRFVLDLCSNPKWSGGNYADVVYIRKCVSYILRRCVGRLLGEKSQHAACKEIGLVVAEYMNSVDLSMDSSMDRSMSSEASAAGQHVLVVALQELGCLVHQLGTSVTPMFTEASGIMEPVFAVLLHPCPPVRLAGAWCLRCVTSAVPSQITPLIDRCLSRMEHMKASGDAISGYSLALAALLGGSYDCPLGIPHSKGKQVFSVAEELLRTASQTSRLTLAKTQAGWLLMSSVMSLGPGVVKHLLPKMLLLWRNAFPRSSKEAEAEKSRGDGFTWQVTLDGRAGALSAMQSFFAHCKDLITDDVVRRMLVPVDAALTMLSFVPQILRQHGTHLRQQAAMVRHRLYNTLAQLRPKHFEGCFPGLLRELVAEFTLTDNPSAITSSLLRHVCHHDDSIILGSWLQDTDQSMIEDQLQQLCASCPGALENDPYMLCAHLEEDTGDPPSPLPLSVAVIDSSVRLFGAMFPLVPAKHRLQMLDHFSECIRQAKGPRQSAVQINIFTALLCSLKSLAEQKGGFESDAVRKSAINLILGSLGSGNPVLRCAAAEALGRVAQVVGDPKFVAELAQYSFDKLKGCRDVVNRTGFSLALGCLHRYVGGLGSGHHLNTSISVLLALSQDTSSPVVQIWALHALGLIADSGGPMFRGYVEPSLALSLKCLLNVPFSHADVHQCVGKLISALITTVGPELQNNAGNIVTTRSNFLAACAVMTEHTDALVRSEAVACLQQLHMFAPRHVNLSSLVPQLCTMLRSEHLILRKAAVSCMRQLAQREAREVHEHAQVLVPQGVARQRMESSVLPDTGLEGALFAMLDSETDPTLTKHVKETLVSLAQCLAGEQLTHWLNLCKDILAATSASELSSSQMDEKVVASSEGMEEDDEDGGGAEARFGVVDTDGTKSQVAPRWPTRVFSVDIVRKIVVVCETERAHFDLALAKELQYSSSKTDYLVLHLSDLVRMAFMAATSDSTPLRLAGLAALQDVITKFSRVPEPEFPGHVILEQFQAQVGAALRPAFSPETPSHITAAACQVCSTWIGSGVARDLNDLRRVHQLLVSSLTKLKQGSPSTQLYNESATTLEKLAILKAWAEVYIVAMKEHNEKQQSKKALQNGNRDDDSTEAANGGGHNGGETLLELVTPELSALTAYWLAALKDWALLSLPLEFSHQLPVDGGAYYTPETVDTVRPHYKPAWAPILLAAGTWLTQSAFGLPKISDEDGIPERVITQSYGSNAAFRRLRHPKMKLSPEETEIADRSDRFFLIFGICMEALCSPRSLEPPENVQLCLEAMGGMLDSEFAQHELMGDVQIAVEILNVMHRMILTRESQSTQLLAIRVVEQIVLAAENSTRLARDRDSNNNDDGAEDDESEILNESTNIEHSSALGDAAKLKMPFRGREQGVIQPGKSLVYAAMEVCLCCLVRQIPQVSPGSLRSKTAGGMGGGSSSNGQSARRVHRLTAEAHQLLIRSINIMTRLPPLCSSEGSLSILPIMLYLIIGVLRETSRCDPTAIVQDVPPGTICAPAGQALQALKSLVGRPVVNQEPGQAEQIHPKWINIIQSAFWSVLELDNRQKQVSIDDYGRVDRVAILLASAVFLISGPPQVTAARNIQSTCVALYNDALMDNCVEVRQKCLQTLQSVFVLKDRRVAYPYVQALGLSVLESLKALIQSSWVNPNGNIVFDATHTVFGKELSLQNLQVYVECLKCAESLVAASDDKKRVPLVSVIIQLLTGLLEIDQILKKPRTTTELSDNLNGSDGNEVDSSDSDRKQSDAGTDVIKNPIISSSSKSAENSNGDNLSTTELRHSANPALIKSIKDHALGRLIKIGSLCPVPFKSVMTAFPELRLKLESAIRANPSAAGIGPSRSRGPSAGSADSGAVGAVGVGAPPVQPKIKLTMDFSNFSKPASSGSASTAASSSVVVTSTA